MVEAIKDFIIAVFGNSAWLGIIILAMIPVTELRVTIPFALSEVWGASKLTWWQAYICSVIGATIPALFIVPLLIPFFSWLKKTKWFGKIVGAFDRKFSQKSGEIQKKVKDGESLAKANRIKFWGVVMFVAVPLPLTGAWTGSAVAAYLKMNPLKGILAVFIGNICSGAIMTVLCVLFPNYVDMILYAFLGLVVVIILVSVIVMLIKNHKSKKLAADAPAVADGTTPVFEGEEKNEQSN